MTSVSYNKNHAHRGPAVDPDILECLLELDDGEVFHITRPVRGVFPGEKVIRIGDEWYSTEAGGLYLHKDVTPPYHPGELHFIPEPLVMIPGPGGEEYVAGYAGSSDYVVLGRTTRHFMTWPDPDLACIDAGKMPREAARIFGVLRYIRLDGETGDPPEWEWALKFEKVSSERIR